MNVGRALLTGVQWEQPPWQLSLWGSSKRQVNNMLVLNASYRFKSRSCRTTSTNATRWEYIQRIGCSVKITRLTGGDLHVQFVLFVTKRSESGSYTPSVGRCG